MNAKISRYLQDNRPATPCLVMDLDVVKANYQALRHWLPLARVYYAVKANPTPDIVQMLVEQGSFFDVASRGEINLCLDCGASPDNLSFGNTIKKSADIAYAYDKGIRLFAFDSQQELHKIAKNAPGSRVFCRVLMTCEGAEWPLSRKFGCEVEMAHDLLIEARSLGLEPYGVSFHVGSQQTNLEQWDVAVGKTALLFSSLNEAGIGLKMVNLGGGFPAHYHYRVAGIDSYAHAVMDAMTRHFGNDLPAMIIEPGRSLVGDAGVVESEVILVSHKSHDDPVRWVYLDVGRFGGMVETMDEAIKYRIETDHPQNDEAAAPVILAGPTCDSVDILYEQNRYSLPLSLGEGDRVRFLSAGAYTASCASVGFNGFDPMTTICI